MSIDKSIDNTQLQQQAIASSQTILDLLQKQTGLDKVVILSKLLEIYDIDINIAGDKRKVLNIELVTEYPNVNYTKVLTKNETWRATLAEVLHYSDVNEEKIVGNMDTQFMLKMISHRRKRTQEVVNALRNETALTEVVPQKQKTKRFFGMG